MDLKRCRSAAKILAPFDPAGAPGRRQVHDQTIHCVRGDRMALGMIKPKDVIDHFHAMQHGRAEQLPPPVGDRCNR